MRQRLLVWTFLAAAVLTVLSQAQVDSTTTTIQARGVDYGKLPLTFEKNQGQMAAEVRFLSRGAGYTAYLTAGSTVLSLGAPVMADSSGPTAKHAATVQLTLVGAARNPVILGEDPQPGKVNYFFGNDPKQWRTNVPTYGRVRYQNVYPGIDLVYYGSNRQLEYDFEVNPGSDPRQIQFEIQGASQISLDSQGNLVLEAGSGEIRLKCPMVYQQIKGQRVPVEGTYVVTDSAHVAFQISHYDASKPLVIDPVLLYSTYLGGSGTDQAAGIAVDGTGNVYLTGYTNSTNFPLATLGTLARNANHVFVAKLNSTGTNLIYTDYIGGNNEDYGAGLVLDSANNVYVTGSTESSNFPVVDAYQSQQPGPYSGFLTKVSADGSSLLYSTYLGGSTFDKPTTIAIDSLGQVHVAGYTESQNFPTANAHQATALASQGGNYGVYGFLTTFSVNGSSLVYSTYFAGSTTLGQRCGNTTCYPPPFNTINAIAVDANGNSYVTGRTNTNNFPATTGAYLTSNPTQSGATVGFVSKFSSAGGLDYSTYLYGTSGDPVEMNGIAVDGSGSAYVTGTAGSDGTFPITSTGICDPGDSGFACSYAFVTKFDAGGSTLLYSTFLGPNNYVAPQAMALDSANDAYVVAATSRPSFQTSKPTDGYTNRKDLLLVEIDPSASTTLFSTYFGGSGNDSPASLALDSSGNIYLAGSTNSTDLRVTQGAFQSMLAGNSNTFIAKIGTGSTPNISLQPTAAISPTSVTFPSTPVGVSSATQTITLTNTGDANLNVTSIQISGDYTQTNNCPSVLVTSSGCTLTVTFTPTTSGSRSGALTITDNAAGSPQTVTLSGTGADFSLTSSPSLATVNPGSTATYTVTVAPLGGAFSSAIKLTCGNAPALTNCNISPSLATPGSNSTSVTVTITTTGSSAEALPLIPLGRRPAYAVWAQLQGLGIFGTLTFGSRRRRKNWLLAIVLALLLSSVMFMSACAGGAGIGQQQQTGTAPGTYTITVTGTSGSLQHALSLRLVVQ